MGEKLQDVLKILKHLAIVTAILLLIIVGFFYVYLPIVTNHGDSISVPNLEGKDSADLDEFMN